MWQFEGHGEGLKLIQEDQVQPVMNPVRSAGFNDPHGHHKMLFDDTADRLQASGRHWLLQSLSITH